MNRLDLRADNEVQADRVVALLCLGVLRAIREGVIGFDEAGYQLFWPAAQEEARKAGCSEPLLEALDLGSELRSVSRLVPEAFESSLNDLESKLCAILSRTKPGALKDMTRWMSGTPKG